MPKTARRTALDPSDPQVLHSTDWLSGPDTAVLARLGPLRWDPVRDGRTMREALKSAIDGHRPAVVAALIDAGVPVGTVLREEHRDVSALRAALVQRNPEVVQALLERGARLRAEEEQVKPAALWLLAQKPRTKNGSPERKRAREAQILDLLVAHGLAHRPDPAVMRRLASLNGGPAVLDAALDHGLLNLTPTGDDHDLLLDALAQGQESLAQRLIGHGARPRTDRAHALDELVLAALRHAPRERDVPGRWQHRALVLIERLAPMGPDHDLQVTLGRLLAQAEKPEQRAPTVPSPASCSPTFPLFPSPPHQAPTGASNHHREAVLRLAAAGVWPEAWWRAVQALDRATIDRWLAVEQGACAHWVNEHNQTALHVLMHALHPAGPLDGVLDGSLAVVPGDHASALSAAQQDDAHAIAHRLLAHGVSPLWGSGGMSAPGTGHATGALWTALDLPGPLGEAVSTTMLDALGDDERTPLIARAVQDRRSRRTLNRLVAHGVPLNAPWEGLTALHRAVGAPERHAWVPVLIGLGATVDVPNDQGSTPRDLAQALWDRHQGTPRGDAWLEQVRVLDIATLEQAVQEGLPQGNVPGPRPRPRL